MNTALGTIGIIVGIIVAIGLYFLPTFIAVYRRDAVPWATIFILNFFLGLTVVVWIVCLAWSFKSRPQPVQFQYGPPRGMVPPPGY